MLKLTSIDQGELEGLVIILTLWSMLVFYSNELLRDVSFRQYRGCDFAL